MGYWLSIVSNLTVLISDPTSNSRVPFPKCCLSNQLIAADLMACTFVDYNASSPDYAHAVLRPDPTKFQISYGYPCKSIVRFDPARASSAKMASLHHDGSARAYVNNETTPRIFDWEQYCVEVMARPMPSVPRDKNIQFLPVLVTCEEWSLLGLPGPELLSFLLEPPSIALLIITLTLYLAVPELRQKVKDKCFICFLAFLTFMMLIIFSRRLENYNLIDLSIDLHGTYYIDLFEKSV